MALHGAASSKVGTSTNDNAATGLIGEFVTATVAAAGALTLATGVAQTITSISLTAGDWDVWGTVNHVAAATTSVTLCQVGVSLTTAALPTQAGGSGLGTDPLAIYRVAASIPGGVSTQSVGAVRLSIAATTTVFLVASDTFTMAGMTAFGTICARRAR